MISLSNSKNILYIKKMKMPEFMIFMVFIIPFFLPSLLQFFNAPSFLKYTIDLLVLLLLGSMTIQRHLYFNRQIMPFILFFVFLCIFSTIVYLFNYQSIFYFLWGVRNNFRFYVAFFAFLFFLDYDDVTSLFKFLDILFWLNALVTGYQFFVLGYEQDYLGGIFGVEKGCNGSTIIFFAVVISRSLLLYMDGKEKSWLCWLKCAIALVVSSLSELKVFLLFFALILVLSSFLTKFSWKKVFLFILAALLITVSNTILTNFFDSDISFETLFKLITATSYSSGEDLGRLVAIPTISKLFHTTWLSKLFGMGLGNCDTSAFAICNTPFFQSHSSLHYTWFSSAFLFLETGYIGLFLFLLFFVMVFILAYKKSKQENANTLFCQMGMIMSIICFILTFYNSSLRTETGYMAYFVLALPFVANISKTEQELK